LNVHGRQRAAQWLAIGMLAALLSAFADAADAAEPCAAASPVAAPLLDEPARVAQLLELVDARLALMPAVAAYKWQEHALIADPPREQAVIAHAVALAQPLGLAPAPVSRFFELQVRLARDVEEALHAQWRAQGFSFGGPVPRLDTELRPHLDRLTTELLRALYLAAPALTRADIASRYASGAAEALKARGWTPATRAELLATLATMHLESNASLARVRASGVLRVGTSGDYAPFSLESQGRVSGVDIELASSLARQLGVTPVFVRTSWPSLLEDLRRDAFDVAVGGIAATPERRSAAALSVPYLSGGKTLIARCSDAQRLGALSAVDRPGVRVIVNPGGTNESFVRANLHRARIRVFPDNRAIFDEIVAGRADVMITDDTEVELQVHRHPQLCRALPGTLTHADKVLLMARDSELDASVDQWLTGALRAGTPQQLLHEALAR
jgi:cyclohexadienyl dehydratase